MKQNKSLYKFLAKLLRPIVKLLFPYEIRGLENLKGISDGYILCSNHLSNMDPVFFVVAHPHPICFMAKSELFKNKILGKLFSSMGAFAVKRGQGDQQALRQAEEVIKSGNILGVFIEGTRSKTGEFLRPKAGTALLAYSMKAPVVPVCITGTSSDKKIHIFTKTIIEYNVPIMPEELRISEGTRTELKFATNLIMDRIKELRD